MFIYIYIYSYIKIFYRASTYGISYAVLYLICYFHFRWVCGIFNQSSEVPLLAIQNLSYPSQETDCDFDMGGNATYGTVNSFEQSYGRSACVRSKCFELR